MRAHTLRPRERLRKRHQFLNVFRTGVKKESPHFKCNLRANGFGLRRLGLTVGKRTGNAVMRNRIKRLIREFFRRNKALLPESTDIVICAKAGSGRLEYAALNRELSAVLLNLSGGHSPALHEPEPASQQSRAPQT